MLFSGQKLFPSSSSHSILTKIPDANQLCTRIMGLTEVHYTSVTLFMKRHNAALWHYGYLKSICLCVCLFFQALGIDPKNVKALYRMGKVF